MSPERASALVPAAGPPPLRLPGAAGRSGCDGMRGCRTRARRGGGGLGDGLTDFMTGGPKLRKWYGQADQVDEGEEGGDGEGDEECGEALATEQQREGRPLPDGEVILVTDAMSLTGDQVLLQLILARQNVRVLCMDAKKVKAAYGQYAEPVESTVGDALLLRSAMVGVTSVVCVGVVGEVPRIAAELGVRHIVLVSSVGRSKDALFAFGSLIGSEEAVLSDPGREAAVQNCGVPYTIVRAGNLKDTPGGCSRLAITAGSGAQGSVAREDLAWVVTQALQLPASHGRAFQVASDGPGPRPLDLSDILQQVPDMPQSR